jgi:hypothetical protein
MNRKIRVKDIKDLSHLSNCMEFDIVDGEIKSVTVFLCGEEVTITKSSDYSSSLNVLVNESKVEQTTYSVVGKIGDMEIYPVEFGTDKSAAECFIQDKKEYNSTELLIEENVVFVDKTKLG